MYSINSGEKPISALQQMTNESELNKLRILKECLKESVDLEDKLKSIVGYCIVEVDPPVHIKDPNSLELVLMLKERISRHKSILNDLVSQGIVNGDEFCTG